MPDITILPFATIIMNGTRLGVRLGFKNLIPNLVYAWRLNRMCIDFPAEPSGGLCPSVPSAPGGADRTSVTNQEPSFDAVLSSRHDRHDARVP